MKPKTSTKTYAVSRQPEQGLASLGRPPVPAPSLLDFAGGMFEPNRQATPEQVLQVLRQASGGSLRAQWELFSMMEDTWPRLAKNLGEVRRAASRASYVVHGADCEEYQADAADMRSQLVRRAIGGWCPRPGTLDLSFEDTLFHALDALGKGLSVLAVRWFRAGDGVILPASAQLCAPCDYGWNGEGNELGWLEGLNNETWRSFAPGEVLCGVWMARSGAPGATALLRSLTPYWLGSLFGWRWLMSNAQLFGVPFRWATYRREDANIRDQLQTMLSAMGACGYAAFPEGTDVKFLEAGKTSSDNPQVIIQTMADRACDLLILGQELSGEAQAAGLGSGSSALQASVRADRLAAAASWCADLLNYQLLPALLEANFGNQDFMPVISADLNVAEDPKALAERDGILLGAGVQLPKKWFFQRHGIPQPEEGEELVGNNPAAAETGFAQKPPFFASKAKSGTNPPICAAATKEGIASPLQTGAEEAADSETPSKADLNALLAEIEASEGEILGDNALADRIGAAAYAAAKSAFAEKGAANA